MFRTILSDSADLYTSNFRKVVSIAGAWLVILALFDAPLLLLPTDNPTVFFRAVREYAGVLRTLDIAQTVLGIVAFCSIAVAWHRFVLLAEKPCPIHLRVWTAEFQYLLRAVQVGVVALVAFAAAYFISVGIVWAVKTASLGDILRPLGRSHTIKLTMAGCLTMLPFISRLALILPAEAIGKQIGMRAAYTLGRGTGWRMVLSGLVLFIPIIMLQFVTTAIVSKAALILPVRLFLLGVVNNAIALIGTVMVLSVLSVAYAVASGLWNDAATDMSVRSV